MRYFLSAGSQSDDVKRHCGVVVSRVEEYVAFVVNNLTTYSSSGK